MRRVVVRMIFVQQVLLLLLHGVAGFAPLFVSSNEHAKSSPTARYSSTTSNDGATTTRIPTTNGPLQCKGYSVRDSWSLIVLGDLHMEDDMSAHEQARDDCITACREMSLIPSPPAGSAVEEEEVAESELTVKEMIAQMENCKASELSAEQLEMLLARRRDGDLMKCYMVSLGDLGRKDIRHEPGDAGTTKSFVDAKKFLDSFKGIPYDVVTGNHDLEGLDEFDTDEGNLKAFLNIFDKDTPQFSRYIGEKTLLLGLSTVRFRESPFSSHEVHVDEDQLEWFQRMVQQHSAEEGWKILVFSHAPIMGSGLRVLQNVHVTNGCAWLNHCSTPDIRSLFIRTVQQNPQIKLWCSGHFHLSHDYQDAISTVGSCTFVQVGVVGPASTRDGRRQTRFIQGCSNRMKIYTINHHIRNPADDGNDKAAIRLDADIHFDTGKVTLSHGGGNNEDDEINRDDWFQAYTPREQDGCYIESPNGAIADATSIHAKVCWWHMKDGRVIGLHQGQLVEYDSETLSPLGIVVTAKALGDRNVFVVENGTALVLVNDKTREIEVVHPNEDGSYWRKFQRNKRVRQEEKAREAIAKMWMEKGFSN